jgi:hypothetical protein
MNRSLVSLLCALFLVGVSVAFAQTLPTEQSITDASKDPTDCKATYPGDTPSDVNLRDVCEKIKAAGGSSADVQAALEQLDSVKAGVYGCNGMALYGPVGMAHAQGTYVPVSEEAVALNTYILVNKVCVLDAVARNQRNALVAGLERAQIRAINEGGEGGRPQYPQDLARLYHNEIPQKVMEAVLRSKEAESMCAPLRDSLIKQTAKTFYQSQTDPAHRIRCTFSDQDKLRALYEQGRIDLVGWGGFQQSLEENNNPYLLKLAFNDYIDATIENEVSRQKEELQHGNGFFAKKRCTQVPSGNGEYETRCDIVTPGKVVAESASYLALSGNRLVESADEINKMVGTVFANLTSQILASNTGFNGATTSVNGAPSYLDGAVNSAYQTAQTGTITTGVEALQKALTIETTYVSVRTNSKKILETAIVQINNLEKTCFTTLVAQGKVDLQKQISDAECAKQTNNINNGTGNQTCSVAVSVKETVVKTPDGDVTVLDAKGPTIRQVVALKTPGTAQPIITSTIQPMLDIVTKSLNAAQKGLALLKQLETTVRNASTPSLVAYVIQQLNQLITANVLHSEGDVASARDQHGKIEDTMQSLIDRTKEDWEAGWCQASKWPGITVPTPSSYK